MIAVIMVIALVGAVVLVAVATADSKQRNADRGKEVKRTCKRCATSWFMTPVEAREQAPDRAEVGAAKMYRAGKRVQLVTFKGSAAEQQVARLEDRAERVRARGACPKCGSTSYNETVVDL